MRRLTYLRWVVGFSVFVPAAARAQPAPSEPAAAPDVVVETGAAHADAPPTAPPAPSRGVFVHVESPSAVDLQRKRAVREGEEEDEPFDTICTSPCDTYVPPEGRYRIGHDPNSQPGGASNGIRASSEFSLPRGLDHNTLSVEPATRGGLAGGIVLTSLGGVALDVALIWAWANGFASLNDGGTADMTGPAVALLGGIGLITGGVTLIVRNVHSRVSLAQSGSALANPPGQARIEAPWLHPDFGSAMSRDGLERALPRRGLGVPLVQIAF